MAARFQSPLLKPQVLTDCSVDCHPRAGRPDLYSLRLAGPYHTQLSCFSLLTLGVLPLYFPINTSPRSRDKSPIFAFFISSSTQPWLRLYRRPRLHLRMLRCGSYRRLFPYRVGANLSLRSPREYCRPALGANSRPPDLRGSRCRHRAGRRRRG